MNSRLSWSETDNGDFGGGFCLGRSLFLPGAGVAFGRIVVGGKIIQKSKNVLTTATSLPATWKRAQKQSGPSSLAESATMLTRLHSWLLSQRLVPDLLHASHTRTDTRFPQGTSSKSSFPPHQQILHNKQVRPATGQPLLPATLNLPPSRC